MSRARPRKSVDGVDSTPKEADGHQRIVQSLVSETMERVVRLLWRNGASVPTIEQALERACADLPSAARPKRRINCELLNASHALTVWFSDPDYLDPEGKPRGLPLRGPLSLETLGRRAGLALGAAELLKYLVRVKGVRRIGHRYVPRRRGAVLIGTGPLAEASQLRVVLGLLRTLDSNDHHSRSRQGEGLRIATVVENPRFPLQAKGVFEARVTRDVHQLLEEIDARMLRHERRRQPGEPTVRLGIGVFEFLEERGGKRKGAGPVRTARVLPGRTRRR